MSKGSLAPLTGAAFVVLAVVSFVVPGEGPTATEDPLREIVRYYVDNEGSVIVASIIATFAALLFVFFGGVLRRVLRDAEGPGGVLSAVAFGGTLIFATGVALDATITFALADAADKLQPGSVQTLVALWNNDYLVFALGLALFLLASGISIVRHGALPKWIGWVAIVLGVLTITPVGFFAFLASGLLVLAMSIVMTMRARREPAAGT